MKVLTVFCMALEDSEDQFTLFCPKQLVSAKNLVFVHSEEKMKEIELEEKSEQIEKLQRELLERENVL